MRTRSQGYQAPPNSDGGASDISASGGNNSDQQQLELGERSSVPVRPPTSSQTQPEVVSAMPDNSEPVFKASDRRIRTLLAKTTTGKMVMDTSMTELNKMAKRHEDYVKAGEPAEMLVDRAFKPPKKEYKG